MGWRRPRCATAGGSATRPNSLSALPFFGVPLTSPHPPVHGGDAADNDHAAKGVTVKSPTFRFLGPACALALALAARPAAAHFVLQEPACYSDEDVLGSPQKSAPCGQDDPGQPVVASGKVTAFQQGQTISITINEMIPHPGHYRVSIAKDLASLPADPPVTAGSSPCGSTVIQANPQLPLLGDGLLVHTSAFSGPQTMKVQLPPGFTCDGCVLQVAEFMSSHPLNNPGGCFYHHCANITVTGATSADAGSADASAADAGGLDVTVDLDTAPDTAATVDATQAVDAAPDAADALADAGALVADADASGAHAGGGGGAAVASGCQAGPSAGGAGWAVAAFSLGAVAWARRRQARARATAQQR